MPMAGSPTGFSIRIRRLEILDRPLSEITRLNLDALGRLAGDDPGAEPQIGNVDFPRGPPQGLMLGIARVR